MRAAVLATRRTCWLAAGALVLLTLATYGRTVRFDFIKFDDPGYVLDNPLIKQRSLASWLALWDPRHTQSRHLGQYAPVRDSLFKLEYAAFGPDPRVFHGTNVLLHLGCVLALWAFLRRLGVGDAAAFLAAELFAIHPLTAEVASWVSARKDSLGLLFAFAALGLLARAGRKDSLPLTCASLLCQLLAVLVKPTFVVIPLVAGAMSYTLPRFSLPLRVRALGTFLPVVAAVPVACLVIARIPAEHTVIRNLQGMAPTPSTLGYVLWKDLVSFVCPLWLAPVYGLDARPHTVGLARLCAVAFLLAVLALGVLLIWRRKRAALCLYAATLAPILPYLNLFPNSVLRADRFLYVPLAALATGLAIALDRTHGALSTRGRKVGLVAIQAVGLGLCLLSLRQSGYYADERPMWERSVEVDEAAIQAQINLAVLLLSRYKDDDHADRAIRQFMTATRYPSMLGATHHALIQLLIQLRQPMAACRALYACRRQGLDVAASEWARAGCDPPG